MKAVPLGSQNNLEFTASLLYSQHSLNSPTKVILTGIALTIPCFLPFDTISPLILTCNGYFAHPFLKMERFLGLSHIITTFASHAKPIDLFPRFLSE
jgi:hypothetical protein